MRLLRCCLFALPAALLLLAALPAHAQTSQGLLNRPMPGAKKATATPAPTPPPALPGATAPYQPAERTQADLDPNDALFDAVNRGDIASARDAINRGAELNAHNVLGMTPLELSVDLGRNDITFLLLSLRGTIGAEPAGPPKQVAAADPKHPVQPGHKVAVAAKARAKPVAHPATAVAAATVPQQFAAERSDPGVPNPQVGFLGFGGSVQ